MNNVSLQCIPASATGNQIVIPSIPMIPVPTGSMSAVVSMNIGKVSASHKRSYIKVPYNITSGTDATTITCTATSVNGGTQYSATTATATFSFYQAKLVISPSQFSASTFGSTFSVNIKLY